MTKTMTVTDEQASELVALLWPYLKKSTGFADRRETAWGSKTKIGLVACIARIVTGEEPEA